MLLTDITSNLLLLDDLNSKNGLESSHSFQLNPKSLHYINTRDQFFGYTTVPIPEDSRIKLDGSVTPNFFNSKFPKHQYHIDYLYVGKGMYAGIFRLGLRAVNTAAVSAGSCLQLMGLKLKVTDPRTGISYSKILKIADKSYDSFLQIHLKDTSDPFISDVYNLFRKIGDSSYPYTSKDIVPMRIDVIEYPEHNKLWDLKVDLLESSGDVIGFNTAGSSDGVCKPLGCPWLGKILWLGVTESQYNSKDYDKVSLMGHPQSSVEPLPRFISLHIPGESVRLELTKGYLYESKPKGSLVTTGKKLLQFILDKAKAKTRDVHFWVTY